MRGSSEAICRHVVPPSSERYSPKSPMTYTRCALELLATETHILPVNRSGSPPPVICFHVTPPSIDLNSLVAVGAVLALPRPKPPPPAPPAPVFDGGGV